MPASSVVTGRVCGQGPFVEVGDPTAVDVTEDIVAVGGDLGPVQWNGRSCYDRSDRSVGWFPVGLYRATDLSCLRVFTSRWPVNSIAVHPSTRFVAVGTGSYDGGCFFEGELLLHDVESGTTVSLLSGLRQVERLTWSDGETLEVLLAPATDEDVAAESLSLHSADWSAMRGASVDVEAVARDRVAAPARDAEEPRAKLQALATACGVTWERRRRAWGIAAGRAGGVVLGLESGIEGWLDESSPAWRIDLDGTCTQLFSVPDGQVVAVVSTDPDLTSDALRIEAASGDHGEVASPGHPAVLVSRRDGRFLIRDTRHGSGYDLFNHYFDVRRAKDFLVLVGDDPRPHQDKWVASVLRPTGEWKVQRLFPLAWEPGVQLFGGPGVYVEDDAGAGLIHTGTVHDGKGLLPGNSFVARRRFPDGPLEWLVRLDNQVTALDEYGGRVVAVTNLGELRVIGTANGQVIGETDRITVAGHRVVPLSLVLTGPDRGWVGTLDGRAVEVVLPAESQPLATHGV